MRAKIEKLDPGKVFLAGAVLILVVYGLLWLVQSLCIKILQEAVWSHNISCMGMPVAYPKYSVPFPIGWCMVLEWFAPLLLCLSYVAVAAGQKRIHTILCTITGAGFVGVCLGKYGLQIYSRYSFFTNDTLYWRSADEHIGKFLPLYFVSWLFAALFLMLAASEILKRFGRSRKAKTVCLFLMFLFSLSEGILFNVVYFGQYTAFYIARNILVLGFILFTVWRLNRQDEVQTDVEAGEKERNKKEIAKPVKLFGIGMAICILFYVLVKVAEVLIGGYRATSWEQSWFVNVIKESIVFLYQHYAFCFAVAGSVYTVKAKRSYGDVGVLAALCGIAFLAQRFVYTRDFEPFLLMGAKTGLTAWCIILFLLFTWLWKESRVSKMVFNVILYLIVIGSTCMEAHWVMENKKIFYYFYILWLAIMLIITLCTLAATKTSEEKAEQSKKGIFVWFFLFSYAMIAVCDYEISILPRVRHLLPYGHFSVLGKVTDYIDIRKSNVLYVFAFLVIVSYLGHALRKKEMQLFGSLAAFAVMYYIEANHIYEIGTIQNWRIGLPISMLIMMALLFFFPFLTKLFPKKENILGGMFLLVTYVVLFLNYVLPLTTCDLSKYRWVPYVMSQMILLGITVLTFVLYGKNQAMIRRFEKKKELQVEGQI